MFSLSLVGLVAASLIPSTLASISEAIPSDFPDPSLFLWDGVHYAFSTSSGGLKVPVATSTDFATWTKTGSDALPTLGAWSDNGAVWAPDVVQIADGSFVMYYAASKADGSTHCIGAAKSTSVSGPYTAEANYIACPASQGGAIDPAGFVESDGSHYVVYKIDGNSIGHGGNCNNGVAPLVSTPIMIQPLQSDGVTPTGSPTQLLDRSDADGPLIEAPSLIKVSGIYYLFFSSNCYSSQWYDVTWATADSLFGPYTKRGPLLLTGTPYSQLYAPGGMDVSVDGQRMVFHADQSTSGYNGVRPMWTAYITVSNYQVTI